MTEDGLADPRSQRIALAVASACSTYAVVLVAQHFAPAIRDVLAVELAPGVRPTYYLRCLVSVLVGGAAAAIVRPGTPRREMPVVWATGAAVVAAALLVILFP